MGVGCPSAHSAVSVGCRPVPAETVRFWYCFVMPGKYWDAVMEVAVDHGGYVTPALLPEVPPVELRKMVSRGTLESVAHGVYRVPVLPHEPFDEFVLAILWARGRAVISHESALVVHGLADINPFRIHLTVPRAYRIARRGGELYEVHHADLPAEDVTRIDAVAVTSVPRTLHDCVGTVPTYLVRQALAAAAQRGAIKRRTRQLVLAELEVKETP